MSRNLFYVSIALLLALSVLATLLLYRNVQLPIRQLIMGVRRIKEGEFWVRLKKQPGNEFGYLFRSFNEMAAQIQELIDKVYKETLRSKEARLKHSLADTLPWDTIGIGAVFKAYSASEALEILKTNTIDILISDIRMPGMDGLELLAQVRRSWKKVKFILLSGHAEFAYAQEAIGYGLFGYCSSRLATKMSSLRSKAPWRHCGTKTTKKSPINVWCRRFRKICPG